MDKGERGGAAITFRSQQWRPNLSSLQLLADNDDDAHETMDTGVRKERQRKQHRSWTARAGRPS